MEHETRRGALKCMLWAGTGILWTVSGGIPRSSLRCKSSFTRASSRSPESEPVNWGIPLYFGERSRLRWK